MQMPDQQRMPDQQTDHQSNSHNAKDVSVKLPGPLKRAYQFVKEVALDYSEDNGSLVAAAVSFYVFISLIPMLLLAVAVLGYFLSPQDAQSVVLNHLSKYAPSAVEPAKEIVREVVGGAETATGLGILALLWTGTTALAMLEKAINVAWGIERKRNYLVKRALGVMMFVVVGALLGVSTAISAGVYAIRDLDVGVFGVRPADWPWVWSFFGYSLPLLVTVSTFTLIYKILPNTYVRLKVALIGGVFAGILWEAAKVGFSYYAANFANYSKVYGSLGGVILLVVWINYSAVVTILGAEVASVVAKGYRRHEAQTR